MVQSPRNQVRRPPINKIIVAAGVGVLVIVIGLIVGAFFIGQQLVDIMLILAALSSLATFVLLGYATLKIVAIVKDVRGEVTVLLNSAQETLTEVQGTARFVNDNVVSPVARAAGAVSATRAAVKSFTAPLYKRRS